MGRHLPDDTSLLVLVEELLEVTEAACVFSVLMLAGNPTTAGMQRHATNTFIWRE